MRSIRPVSCSGADMLQGPYTAHLRTFVAKAIPGMVCETQLLKSAAYGPFGCEPRVITCDSTPRRPSTSSCTRSGDCTGRRTTFPRESTYLNINRNLGLKTLYMYIIIIYLMDFGPYN